MAHTGCGTLGRLCPLWLSSKALPGIMFEDALKGHCPQPKALERESWLSQTLLHGLFTVGPTHRTLSLPDSPPVLAFPLPRVLSPQQGHVSLSALDHPHEGGAAGG